MATVGFCMIAGSVYVFNDLNDIEEDRNHPKKKHRPIASGDISYRNGLIYATLLAIIGIMIYGYLGVIPLAIVLLYILQNILYSSYLKEIVILDLFIVAFGMVLRAIIGFVVIDSYVIPSVLIMVFMAALLLVSGKRKREMEAFNDVRKVLKDYTKEEINQIYIISLSLVLTVYTIYILRQGRPGIITILPAYYSVFRYHHLISNGLIDDEVKDLLLDIPFIVNLLIWTILIVTTIQFI
jgi:4-hydroxybenzoate polyprenyltransferase